MLSVIIPAYNEESTITECLEHLLRDADSDNIDTEIVVVCNGCSDRTATIARECGSRVKVVETPVPSKSNALNVGDEEANHFPRIYLDSDVRVGPGSLKLAIQKLESGSSLIVAPQMKVDMSGTTLPVRAYYRVWTKLPYFLESAIGSGFYAMGEAGRARFGRFPDITADDAYARLSFGPSERAVLRDAHFIIRAPRNLRNLVKIKVRSCFGNLELFEKYPHLAANEDTQHQGALLRLAADPSLWLDLLIYLWVKLLIRMLAQRKLIFGDRHHWERDESSREGRH